MATRTAKEVALQFETTPRNLRKFLRSKDGLNTRVGKGNRWSIEAKDVRKLRKSFDAWEAAKAEKATEDAETDEIEEIEEDSDSEDGE